MSKGIDLYDLSSQAIVKREKLVFPKRKRKNMAISFYDMSVTADNYKKHKGGLYNG